VHAQICTVVAQIAFCHLLINFYDFGIIGAAIATNLSQFAGLITIEALVSRSWGIPTVSWKFTSADGLPRLIYVALWGIVVECSRNYGLQMFLLTITWYHRKDEVSTVILLLNMYTLISCIFEGLSVGISAQVGINITFHSNLAYRYACVGYVFGGIVLLSTNAALYYFGTGWINFLADGDQNILKQVMELAPLLLVFLSL
jgi:Na+-driven multidrug efflux pump